MIQTGVNCLAVELMYCCIVLAAGKNAAVRWGAAVGSGEGAAGQRVLRQVPVYRYSKEEVKNPVRFGRLGSLRVPRLVAAQPLGRSR